MSGAGRGFSSFKRTARFDATYAGLQVALQKQVDKTVALLLADRGHPSLKAHTVKPGKYYWEAYVNRGDRIIYVPDGDCLVLVDVVPHDDIDRYSQPPRQK